MAGPLRRLKIAKLCGIAPIAERAFKL